MGSEASPSFTGPPSRGLDRGEVISNDRLVKITDCSEGFTGFWTVKKAGVIERVVDLDFKGGGALAGEDCCRQEGEARLESVFHQIGVFSRGSHAVPCHLSFGKRPPVRTKAIK